MIWKGRMIGTIIGFFFGPIGAIIGFAIGYFFFDKPKNEIYNQQQDARKIFTGTNGNFAQHKQLIESTFRLAGYVARGAGRINEDHIRIIETHIQNMRLSPDMKRCAIDAFNFGKSPEFYLYKEIDRLRYSICNNGSIISYLLEIEVTVALSDEKLEQDEHNRLLEIAMALGVSPYVMERMIQVRVAEQQFRTFSENFNRQRQRYYQSRQNQQDYYNSYGNRSYSDYEKFEGNDEYEQQYTNPNKVSQTDLAHAYEILGVTPDTPWEEIRRAHKKLMLKYHPDRLASQGLPPEMMQLYTEKAQDIQAAFTLIKSALGK